MRHVFRQAVATNSGSIDNFRHRLAKSAEFDTLSSHRVRMSICSILDNRSDLSGW